MSKERFSNYRKSTNENNCAKCDYCVYEWWGKRPRCGDGRTQSYAVGKTMICDAFILKKVEERECYEDKEDDQPTQA